MVGARVLCPLHCSQGAAGSRMGAVLLWPWGQQVPGWRTGCRLLCVVGVSGVQWGQPFCSPLPPALLLLSYCHPLGTRLREGGGLTWLWISKGSSSISISHAFSSLCSYLPCSGHAFPLKDCPVFAPCQRWQGDSSRVCKLVLLSPGQGESWRPTNMTQENVCWWQFYGLCLTLSPSWRLDLSL